MEITKLNQLLPRLLDEHKAMIQHAKEGQRYFENHNDIKGNGVANFYANDRAAELNPLKVADNRLSHSWHNLLVNQKVAYCLSYPPILDLGNDSYNKELPVLLGDDWAKTIKDLGIDASNCGVAWLHLWVDDEGMLQLAPVDPKQIIPIYSSDLKKKLTGAIRYYSLVNENGDSYLRYEYWDKDSVCFYQKRGEAGELRPENIPNLGEKMVHPFGMVPFVPFYNNSNRKNDLLLYKDLIDAYDKVFSGFNNDLDDVQEVIFVLTNYGGESKDDFVRDLKQHKVIKVDADGGVNTIRAEIPYEARKVFLEDTRKQIFISGMGVDPDPERFGNASGVALKFLYSLLELKASMLETEFRIGFNALVRLIAAFKGWQIGAIQQTWTRNATQNDAETAQIARDSAGTISEKTIVKNHPWVDDPEQELADLEQERTAQQKDEYGNPLNSETGDD